MARARYKVKCSREVLGREPGSEFEAELDPVHEARLVTGAHLVRLAGGELPIADDASLKSASKGTAVTASGARKSQPR